MKSYVVALFTGSSPRDMDLVGVSTDLKLTREVAQTMLTRPSARDEDSARAALDAGRRNALQRIVNETDH